LAVTSTAKLAQFVESLGRKFVFGVGVFHGLFALFTCLV
jgi:hypothetical protein